MDFHSILLLIEDSAKSGNRQGAASVTDYEGRCNAPNGGGEPGERCI